MTPDDIFAKVSSGELSGEELTSAVSALEVDQQADLKKKFAEETSKTLGEMSAIRKEKQRVEDLIKEKQEELEKMAPATPPEPTTPPAGASDDTMKRFREEQKLKAINKFKGDFGLSDDEHQKIVEQFNTMDTGKIDAELIYQDLVGVYAFVNKDKLVQADKERQQREAAAAQATAEAAGGPTGQAPNNGNEPPKYSEAVTALAKEAGISPEAAKKQIEQGTKRTYS